ncbi:MAG: acyl--CoA ligase [Deltaproteobacteria bacterium]|nr:acyl--CoA ligase [Deltaproteobacteria bacterium]
MRDTTDMLLHGLLLDAGDRHPDKEAIVTAHRRTTYAELRQRAEAVAAWLRNQGVAKGERVGILLDEPSDYVSCYFGVLMAGAVVVALNTQTSARTLRKLLNDCGASTLLTHEKFARYLDELAGEVPLLERVALGGSAQRDAPRAAWPLRATLEEVFATRPQQGWVPAPSSPSELAQIIYTSGTTGEPKGVMLRHANLVANTRSIVEYLRLTEQDRGMAVLPFFYAYGNSVLLTHIAVRATLVVNQSFVYPNLILDQMVAEKVTGFSGVPSTYALLLHRSAIRNYRFPDLRYVTQAGGAMAPKWVVELKEVLPEPEIFIMYGQTEASARLSYLDPREVLRKAGSIGKAIPGVSLELLDPAGAPVPTGEVGEIVARGENVMAGYWDQPEATAEVLRPEGLWTGDLARKDEEGFFYIVSRKSELIKSGAHRISPKEIEEVILEHSAVHDVAVLGVPDEILGEAIKAFVVLKTPAAATPKELLQHCRRALPAFKVPQQVQFLDSLPKTDSGKTRKGALKQEPSL